MFLKIFSISTPVCDMYDTHFRLAMLEYGSHSPIGSRSVGFSFTWVLICLCPARQEKLLQGLMTEILQMTSQAQPLKVGVPLYPFSHAGVFPTTKAEDGESSDLKMEPHVAPLPTAFEANVPLERGSGGIWNGGSLATGRNNGSSPPYQRGY